MSTKSMFPFFTLQGPQGFITEEYVSSPPAVAIVDQRGDVFTLGFTMGVAGSSFQQRYETKHEAPKGEFAFNVLRNGMNVGEFASRIERLQGRIKILTASGWKVWNGQSFI